MSFPRILFFCGGKRARFKQKRRIIPTLSAPSPVRIRQSSSLNTTSSSLILYFPECVDGAAPARLMDALLNALAELLMTEVRRDFDTLQQATRRYGEFTYRARSWPQARRVILKAEVITHIGRQSKDNPRFVVTHLKTPP